VRSFHPDNLAALVAIGLLITGLLVGCGQPGELYRAEDDPARAERDAGGKGEPFPFPDPDKPWPPRPAKQSAADQGGE
jgi:hypothetical protein